MATSVSAPLTGADVAAAWAKTFQYLPAAIRLELAERFDPLADGLGLAELIGDVVGSGTDTIRVRTVGGIGLQERMTAMTSETQAAPITGARFGYDEVTVARFALGKSETFFRAIINDDGVDLEMLAQQLANSYTATARYLWAQTGAGFTDSKGTSGAVLDMDDWAGVVAFFEETEGFEGVIKSGLALQQWTQLQASLRAEPGYKFPEKTDATQRARAAGGPVETIWGVEINTSADIQQSGGNHVGFAYAPGAIGWARGSTDRIPVPAGYQPAYVSEKGIIVAYDSNIRQAQNAVVANAFVGFARASSRSLPGCKILSDVV